MAITSIGVQGSYNLATGKSNIGANLSLNDSLSARFGVDPVSGVSTVGGEIKDRFGNSLDVSASSDGSYSTLLTTKDGASQYKISLSQDANGNTSLKLNGQDAYGNIAGLQIEEKKDSSGLVIGFNLKDVNSDSTTAIDLLRGADGTFAATYTMEGADGSSLSLTAGEGSGGLKFSQTNTAEDGTKQTGEFGLQFQKDGTLKYFGEGTGSGGTASGSVPINPPIFDPSALDKFKFGLDHLGDLNDLEPPSAGIPTETGNAINSAFDTAEQTRSPLILDLDGDGVETISEQGGVYFDFDNNGFAEHAGWVGKDDGLLVWDKNGNGQIDDGSELFGNSTQLGDGQKAENGFLALRDLDENNDGQFDATDSSFSSLNVWVDKNSDGVVQTGELLTLEQAGVSSISLSYAEPGKKDANGNVPASVVDSQGNEHRQTGSFTRLDGSVGSIDDVWFDTRSMDTQDQISIEINSEIAALPDIAGIGNVHSLRSAMALDETGQLEDLVKKFAAESDSNARQNIVIDLLYHWAGVQDIEPASRAASQIYGNVIGDARKLATLEAIVGESYLGTWCWGTRDPNPHGPAAAILLQAFDSFAGAVYSLLMLQTHFSTILSSVDMEISDSGIGWRTDDIVSMIKSTYQQRPENAALLTAELGNSLKLFGGMGAGILDALHHLPSSDDNQFDSLLHSIGESSLVGGTTNDTLTGTSDSDVLLGMAGADRLYGNSGNDALVGGLGNDYLACGDGADTYEFDIGDGSDTIYNADTDTAGTALDRIKFGAGISLADIALKRSYYDLIISIGNGADSVTVQSYFDEDTVANHGYAVDEVVFADGTVLTIDQVKQMVVATTAGDDSVWGYANDDIIDGGTGNDNLYGLSGSDTLLGGSGDDRLDGGIGNDTLEGGTGKDSLSGGDGSDTYLFSRGWGQDSINNYDTSSSKKDTLVFDTGIAPADIVVARSSSDLILMLRGSTDRIAISNYFLGEGVSDYRLETIQFADGTQWSLNEIKAMAILSSDGNDELWGYSTDDIISGGLGDDTLSGQAGNDSLDGGDGNDYLSGGEGVDQLAGGAGRDSLSGGSGDDTLLGEAGADYLYGDSGNDILDGGTGNDYLTGGEGSDTYRFSRGWGQDSISNYDSGTGKTDAIIFDADIGPADIVVTRASNDLVLTLRGTTDRIAVLNYFYTDGVSDYHLDAIQFTDGTRWSLDQIKAMAVVSTEGNDSLWGYSTDDTLSGGLGDDYLSGQEGDDILIGGAGDDVLYGQSGDDFLDGGDGNDSLSGGDGADQLVGGSGRDTLTGGAGDDILVGGAGDDYVYADSGDDILEGGIGNDYLYAGDGSDTYRFSRGWAKIPLPTTTAVLEKPTPLYSTQTSLQPISS